MNSETSETGAAAEPALDNLAGDPKSILDQDDAALGRAVKRALLDASSREREEKTHLPGILAAYRLIEHALKMGAEQSSIALRGVTLGNDEVGNWTVTVRQWGKVDADSLPECYAKFAAQGILVSRAQKAGRLIEVAGLVPDLLENGQAMLRHSLDIVSALNKLRDETESQRRSFEAETELLRRGFESEREAILHWKDPQDKPLPEDDKIALDFPTTSKRKDAHDLYAEAMRLVGARHSKRSLVMLVTWLLAERARANDAFYAAALGNARVQETLELTQELLREAQDGHA